LSSILVFKGGNALDFVWRPNRSTKDLDFSSLEASLTEESLRTLLTGGLDGVSRQTGVLLRTQAIKRKPPGEDKTRATWAVNIGYALPDDTALRLRLETVQGSPQIVPVEISINEEVCGYEDVDFGSHQPLRVSTLEDIVAEKLRALLQQVTRKRDRRQDLLDIAVLLRSDASLNLKLVAEYLLRKGQAREIVVSKAAFHNPEVRSRAHSDYSALETTTRRLFVPFEEAWTLIEDLIQRLDLPEQ
jgi:predicted nucleotidyltransferase component of viral defense system